MSPAAFGVALPTEAATRVPDLQDPAEWCREELARLVAIDPEGRHPKRRELEQFLAVEQTASPNRPQTSVSASSPTKHPRLIT